ncbi:hypothetical protein FQN50_007245 [Emmonsiellopsis sp. PD_5]|nr:hypothetical protein FQN50_007245 [Emmonsiellopsis sp. PD_5]
MSSWPTSPAAQQSRAGSSRSSQTIGRSVDAETDEAASISVCDLLDADDITDAAKQTLQHGPNVKVKPMAASDVQSAEHAAALFGLHYGEAYPECVWEIPENGAPVHLTSETETILEKMRAANFWNKGSAEALSRTFLNLVVFDLLERHKEELASRNVTIVGEYQMQAKTNEGVKVTGTADYVIGYGTPTQAFITNSLESYSIIVEAKKGTIEICLGQAIAYLVAAQQHQLNLRPQKMTTIIYGIVSDGVSYCFLRLDDKLLEISDTLRVATEKGRQQIYQMVDRIIRASIESSPQTHPHQTDSGNAGV